MLRTIPLAATALAVVLASPALSDPAVSEEAMADLSVQVRWFGDSPPAMPEEAKGRMLAGYRPPPGVRAPQRAVFTVHVSGEGRVLHRCVRETSSDAFSIAAAEALLAAQPLADAESDAVILFETGEVTTADLAPYLDEPCRRETEPIERR